MKLKQRVSNALKRLREDEQLREHATTVLMTIAAVAIRILLRR